MGGGADPPPAGRQQREGCEPVGAANGRPRQAYWSIGKQPGRHASRAAGGKISQSFGGGAGRDSDREPGGGDRYRQLSDGKNVWLHAQRIAESESGKAAAREIPREA